MKYIIVINDSVRIILIFSFSANHGGRLHWVSVLSPFFLVHLYTLDPPHGVCSINRPKIFIEKQYEHFLLKCSRSYRIINRVRLVIINCANNVVNKICSISFYHSRNLPFSIFFRLN